MDKKKLEARITRLEKFLSNKNEAADLSQSEEMALNAIRNAYDSLRDAIRLTQIVDDNLSGVQWNRVARDLRKALNNFPAGEWSI